MINMQIVQVYDDTLVWSASLQRTVGSPHKMESISSFAGGSNLGGRRKPIRHWYSFACAVDKSFRKYMSTVRLALCRLVICELKGTRKRQG